MSNFLKLDAIPDFEGFLKYHYSQHLNNVEIHVESFRSLASLKSSLLSVEKYNSGSKLLLSQKAALYFY